MTSTETYSFDLSEEMIKRLEEEFGPEALRAALKAGGDKPREALLADFGRRWMERSLELGQQYSDRTYETLKAAAAKTGSLSFPFIPERFIEIAYLSTQPIYTLPIVENGARGLVFRVPFCGYVKVIREELGEEEANRLQCKEACLAACRLAFERFGFKVAVSMDAAVPGDEYCQFSIRPA
jgi:hypothetical protein